jgi:glycosyltransferase involved in cell wall biosynthesis
MTLPMISVITATYNAERTLPALIASLRAQSDRSFEWIVVDGASTDRTMALLEAAGDVVTRWVSEADFGIYHALNKGLLLARGDYYLVVGADDQLEAGAVEAFARAAAGSDADIVAAPVFVDGSLVTPRTTMPWLRSGPPLVAAHSVGSLIRRSLHDEIGMYSRRFPIAADTFFLLQASRRGKRFAYIAQPVGTFGTSGASSGDILGGLCESFRANVEARGGLLLHLLLLTARVVANHRRIVANLRLRNSR